MILLYYIFLYSKLIVFSLIHNAEEKNHNSTLHKPSIKKGIPNSDATAERCPTG